ncbi:hypothetical protein LAJ19_20280 (plasmid) [Deinococcus taeanensis]|uniref:DprA-like winged helix domain-containing protein n=1 Tax=Deinococcus taeanensis TaxID=2737050 RepID=UPI001CDCFC5A|nr:hypothetical protein [Deinococcus taeanensis]UBV45465.1 hypothetical protein LAJ19_20280 [Deinococcus taeanensis]
MTRPTAPPSPAQAAALLMIWQVGPLSLDTLARHWTAGAGELRAALSALEAQGLIDRTGTLYRPEGDEHATRQAYAHHSGVRACAHCGCSDLWGCPDGCWWTGDAQCSACAAQGVMPHRRHHPGATP